MADSGMWCVILNLAADFQSSGLVQEAEADKGDIIVEV